MAALSLREELLALPGVAEAEVDGDDSAPSGVRIRLAPQARADLVGSEVQRLLATRGVRSRLGGEAAVAVPPLFEPLPGDEAAPPGSAVPVGGLQSVMVEEGRSGLRVTVVTTDGRRATGRGEPSEAGLVAAVIAAVGELAEGVGPRVLSVDWREIDGSRVVTLVLEAAGGRRGAGAAVVHASPGYALARAAWSALTD